MRTLAVYGMPLEIYAFMVKLCSCNQELDFFMRLSMRNSGNIFKIVYIATTITYCIARKWVIIMFAERVLTPE